VRVTIDARPAVDREKTGVGYYAWHLIRRLPEVDPETTYVAWYVHFRTVLGRRRHFDDVGLPNLRERGIVYPSRLLERTGRYGFPRVEWFGRFDVLFGTNFVPPPTRAARIVVTVHDLAFRRYPETAPQAVAWWREALERTLRRAKRVIVPSAATRDDLIELYRVEPERVAVIPLAVDPEVFRPPTPDRVAAARERFDIDGPYLLALGRTARKNLPRLLWAFASIPADLRPKLVVAGAPPWSPDGTDATLDALEALPRDVREAVAFVGYVTDEQKVALLGGALALAYPSLYEGFGFPALEAMACGTPVVASRVSSLPEIVGPASVLVDPLDADSIAEGLVRVIDDASLRARLREAGLARAAEFDWGRTARATARVLRLAADA
jgi:glycosyltransferase involved in cell wall biosynthesis